MRLLFSISYAHIFYISTHIRAPSQSTRSPPKAGKSAATSAAAQTHVEEKEQEEQENNHVSDSDQPALVRFARLKQHEQEQQNNSDGRVLGPRVINTPPNPERWTVKDTSVNVASAFHRAANSTVIPAHDSSLSSNTSSSFNNSSLSMNPANSSWASGVPQKNVPRSTSVEYEKETHSIIMNRRLGAPPSRGTRPTRPPPAASTRHIPESDGEEVAPQPVQRGKSPFEHIVEATRRLAPATFLMRRQSEEPEARPEARPAPTNGVQDKSSSYDYSAEEREFHSLSHDQSNGQHKANAAHKRNRMSVDNKAYQPTQSDLEESDEDLEVDGKRTRRKRTAKKHGAVGGPLTSLPVTSYDKRKKKRRDTKSSGLDEDEESSEEEGQSYEQVADQVSRVVVCALFDACSRDQSDPHELQCLHYDVPFLLQTLAITRAFWTR